MRRDTIFYYLFAQSPELFFALLENPPANAADYRFDSVAVKEPTFEIDGVFLPPDTDEPGIIFLCEVQFQRDNQLYERLFGELFLYFYRNRSRFSDWQAVIIYPTRATEQNMLQPYQVLLDSPKVHRVYLDELGEVAELPLGVALMVLTTIKEAHAPEIARTLLARAQQELSPQASRGIIDMVATIMTYKFTQMSRVEVEQMLGMSLQETRVYREAKEEGREAGERSLILRLLIRKVGAVPATLQPQIQALSLEQLESLGEALLDFTDLSDLEAWLAQ